MSEFTDFTIEDPPETMRGGRPSRGAFYAAVGAAARGHAGQWLKLNDTYSTGNTTVFRKTLGPEFEVTSRATDPSPEGGKRYRLYVRYRIEGQP